MSIIPRQGQLDSGPVSIAPIPLARSNVAKGLQLSSVRGQSDKMLEQYAN